MCVYIYVCLCVCNECVYMFGGARGVMVIIVGYGHDTISNPGPG